MAQDRSAWSDRRIRSRTMSQKEIEALVEAHVRVSLELGTAETGSDARVDVRLGAGELDGKVYADITVTQERSG